MLSKTVDNVKIVIYRDFNTSFLNYCGLRDLLYKEIIFKI